MSYKFNNSNRKLNVNVIGQIDIPASILSEVKYGKKIRHVQSALNSLSKTDFKPDYAKPI